MKKYTDSRIDLLTLKGQIVQGYESGLTIRVLANLYDTSPSNIRNFLISSEVVLRQAGRRKKEKHNGTRK